jgi:hypothetical protein
MFLYKLKVNSNTKKCLTYIKQLLVKDIYMYIALTLRVASWVGMYGAANSSLLVNFADWVDATCFSL